MKFTKIQNFLEKHKHSIESLTDIIQSLAAVLTIIGIVYVGLEYHQQNKISREEKAFELYQQFNGEIFLPMRNELKSHFYTVNLDTYPTSEDYIKAMISLWKDPTKYATLLSITNFFEQVATCVDKELCDEEATMALFGTEAKDFFETHAQFFDWHRDVNCNKGLGINLEKFVERYREKNNIDQKTIEVETETSNNKKLVKVDAKTIEKSECSRNQDGQEV